MKTLYIDVSNESIGSYVIDIAKGDAQILFSGIPESWSEGILYASFVKDSKNPIVEVIDNTVNIPLDILLDGTDFYVILSAVEYETRKLVGCSNPILITVGATNNNGMDFNGLVALISRLGTLEKRLAAIALSGSFNDLTDVPVIDESLSQSSSNAIQNRTVAMAFDDLTPKLVPHSEIDKLNSVENVGKLYIVDYGENTKGVLFLVWDTSYPVQILFNPGGEIETRYYNQGSETWTPWKFEIVETSYDPSSPNPQSGMAVAEAIAGIVNGSPEALDTLNELAEALGNDENFSATVMEQIGKKADKTSLEEAESNIARLLDGRASAGKAIRDSKGNYIHIFYATKEEIFNKLTLQKYYGDMNIVPTDSSLFEFDGFNENDLSVEIYGFSETNDIEELVIPYEYTKDEITYNVSLIAPNAFENTTFLKTVVFPSNLDTVADYAFGGCTNLEKAVFSKGNKGIWDAAFSNCTKLKTITLPNTITEIYEKAFDGSGLTDIYYEGTKEQWESISISEDNETLLNANIHFNWSNVDAKVDKADGYGLVSIRSEVIVNVGQVGSVGEPIESDYRILSVLKGRDSSGEAITEDIKIYPAEHVDFLVGDIETSLENIINKYGLGGEAL